MWRKRARRRGTHWGGTSWGAAKPCHRTLRRFSPRGEPTKTRSTSIWERGRPRGRWAASPAAAAGASPQPRGPRVRARRGRPSPAAAAGQPLSARAPLTHPGRPLRRCRTRATHVRGAPHARHTRERRTSEAGWGHARRAQSHRARAPPGHTRRGLLWRWNNSAANDRRGSAAGSWAPRLGLLPALKLSVHLLHPPTCQHKVKTLPNQGSYLSSGNTYTFPGIPRVRASRVTGDSQHTGSCSETKRTQTHVVGKRSWASQRLGKGLKLLHSSAALEGRGDGTLHALTGRNSHKGFRLSTRTSDSQSFRATPGTPGSHTDLKYF